MMRAITVVLCALLPACTWSNSLYQARRLSSEAIELERRDRPFEASGVWSRVAVKAGSALARDRNGSSAAEALWLRGRAHARTGDCRTALASLERALAARPAAEWRAELGLEIGRCLERLGDPRAVQYFEELQANPDPDIQRTARLASGRHQIASRSWESALATLSGLEGDTARLYRSIALVSLARTPDALAELEPLLVRADTLTNWGGVVEAFAAIDPAATDSLLGRLQASGAVSGARASQLLLAAARGAVAGDPESASPRLDRLASLPDPAPSSQGKLMIVERLLAGTTSLAALRAAVDSARVLGTDAGQAAPAITFLGGLGEAILVQHDSVIAGAPQGDMLTFLHAEWARDSLRSPVLAQYFFARVERDWPASPYVPKALLARMVLEPDSADALRERLLFHANSPYVAYLDGREIEAFTQLEVALGIFAQSRHSRVAPTGRPRPATTSDPGVDIP